MSKPANYNNIIPTEINNVKKSKLVRIIQIIKVNISQSLVENIGKNFIEKKSVDNTKFLRIKDFFVNLHLVELRQNLLQ